MDLSIAADAMAAERRITVDYALDKVKDSAVACKTFCENAFSEGASPVTIIETICEAIGYEMPPMLMAMARAGAGDSFVGKG